MVVLDRLAELEGCQVIGIKLDRSLINLLITTRVHLKVLNVVLTVGSVEHLWSIVRVFLFSHTHVDADMCIAESVILEGDIEFVAFRDFLKGLRFARVRLGFDFN